MEIPVYPASRPLELLDRELLHEPLQQLQPQISELSFANLYLFRKAHQYRLSTVEGSLVIFGCGYGGDPYFLPPLSRDRVGAAMFLLSRGETLYGADEQFAGSLPDKEELLVSEDRDNFDYIYLREELAELPGNRFHKKKNRISYFSARHDYSVEVFSGEKHFEGALKLLEEWKRVHVTKEGSPMELETAAAREALELAGPLGLDGIVILLEEEIGAFSLGEKLNSETAVCHFEKSDPFMEGIAQLVNREFSSRLFKECTYVNREQDLGNPGLRGAKSSYRPVSLLKKLKVTLRRKSSGTSDQGLTLPGAASLLM